MILVYSCVVAVVIATVIFLYKCVYAPHQVLQHSGIEVPSGYVPIFGHFFQLKDVLSFETSCVNKHGPVTGYYVGQITMFIISDLDILKDMHSKHFESFLNYPPREKALSGRISSGILLAQGKDWQFRRKLLTPRLSSSRIKLMVPLLERSIKTLVEIVREIADSGKAVNFLRIYERFTIEITLATFFGREDEVQRGESNTLTRAATGIFTSFGHSRLIEMIVSLFPQLDSLIALVVRPSWSYSTLYSILLSLVRERRTHKNSHHKHKDLIQLVVDVHQEDEIHTAALPSAEPTQLSDDAAVNVAMDLLMAGYESTASLMTFTSYLLATHPEEQKRLQAEIDNYFKSNPHASHYEAASEIEYLGMVIHESLRLYPVGARLLRHCNKSTTIGGIFFPKGAWVVIPIYSLHHNPGIWENPEIFDPMRFSLKKKANFSNLFFAPYGLGHHTCLGWKLGVLKVKMALVQILRNFAFITTPETEIPPSIEASIMLRCANGMFLKAVQRH